MGIPSPEIPSKAVSVFDYLSSFPFDPGKAFAVPEISAAEPVDYEEYD